jgi:branched-chain amino acid transport system substrate-binding protein
LLKFAGATALAAPFLRAARADQTTIKIGVVGAKTGPLAPGAAVTHFPPHQLWAHEVNARGGLKLKRGQAKVQLIEYDDHTQPPEAFKAVERLATVDKADWISGGKTKNWRRSEGAESVNAAAASHFIVTAIACAFTSTALALL